MTTSAPRPGGCPDDGACHHRCGDVGPCFRVLHCAPLSAARYLDNRWPADVVAAETGRAGPAGPVDDALNPARRCTLVDGQDYRLRRDLATRLHGRPVTLLTGQHVRVRHASNDLALIENRHGDLLAIPLTRDLDPHGWADVFGETGCAADGPVGQWTIEPATRRLTWPNGEAFVAADWTFTPAEWAAHKWPTCPTGCGATVDVEAISVPTRAGGDAFMVGRWSCPNGCTPPDQP